MGFVDTKDWWKKERAELNETNDCTVRAFAVVLNTTYERAHSHLKNKCGRLDRKGIRHSKMVNLPDSLVNTKFAIGGPYMEKTRTLKKFIEDFPTGRYFICVRGHALAIVDGVVYDYKHSLRRRVKWVMRIII